MSKIGIRISKFQKEVYESLGPDDWIMEYSIPNTNLIVDLYNPKTNTIIECQGDY